jgi:uncharacterized repeat protein (TIGR03803 family)
MNSYGEVTTLHSFTEAEGIGPFSALIQAQDGRFYGTATYGGLNGLGTIYSIGAAGDFTTVHHFEGTDGANPAAALLQTSGGTFYGTTMADGGTIFSMDPFGSLVTLQTLGRSPDQPAAPRAPLIEFYGLVGTSERGGVNGIGTVFGADTNEVWLWHTFEYETWAFPVDAVTAAHAGGWERLFGVTRGYGGGVVFRMDSPEEWDFHILHWFSGWGDDGLEPSGPLIQASDGLLYGTTRKGGSQEGSGGKGVVFRMDLYGNYNGIHIFEEGFGAFPVGGVVEGNDGSLYGVAESGGPLTNGGVIYRLSNAQIAVNQVSPSSGTGEAGAALSVLGGGFVPGMTVTIGGLDATNVIVVDPTFLHLEMPALAPGAYDVTVTAPGGTPSATHPAAFVVNAAGPTITGFTPTAGPVNVKVTINGTGFTGVSSVKFNGKAASFNVLSSTQLTANVSGGTTTGRITVMTPAGTGTSAADFTVAVPPTVTGFTPGNGVPGTSVVITGTNFDTASAVAFDGFGATFTINSSTQLTATVPSSATTGKIKVTNAAGGAYSVSAFQVPATITSFSPASGVAGTIVTINGKTFNNASAVTFNGAAATFTLNSSTKITATAPSGVTTGKIAVTTPGGTTASTTSFLVAPKISSFTPAAGPINVKVTINGTAFTQVSSVKFNGKAASFNVLSPTQLTANVSAGTTTGKITVTTAGGTATSATNFVVAVPPTVTGFTPGSGVPGTSVVITGTGFDTASAVAFNGFGAAFTINSPTQITATVPSSATTGKIKVTNAAGSASSVSSFLVTPTITSFSPASGHTGISVTINGRTFNNASSVTFNGVAAAFTLNSSTKITATVPTGATTGKIKITTPGGTATSATNFTVTP